MATPHLSDQLRHVVQAATLAPSIHNTQPWRFALRPDGFDLRSDPSRRLQVLDPEGRQLHLSCGAALMTARVAARALGLDAEVELLPDPADPQLLARLTLTAGPKPDDDELALALAILHRHTVREPYEPRRLPAELLIDLCRTAEREGAMLRPVREGDEELELSVLLSGADAEEERDAAYRAELQEWVSDRAQGDGIPVQALASDVPRGSSVRLRDFALAHPEHQDGSTPVAEHPDVVVLTSSHDGPRAWLSAGQALSAVLLRAVVQGVQAQPLGQVTDLPGPRIALARALGLVGTPQLVLRLGYATAAAATPRRDLDDVLA